MNYLNAEIVNKFYKTLGIMGESPILSMGKLTKNQLFNCQLFETKFEQVLSLKDPFQKANEDYKVEFSKEFAINL